MQFLPGCVILMLTLSSASLTERERLCVGNDISYHRIRLYSQIGPTIPRTSQQPAITRPNHFKVESRSDIVPSSDLKGKQPLISTSQHHTAYDKSVLFIMAVELFCDLLYPALLASEPIHLATIICIIIFYGMLSGRRVSWGAVQVLIGFLDAGTTPRFIRYLMLLCAYQELLL